MKFKGEEAYNECRLCGAERQAYQALSRNEQPEITPAFQELWEFNCGNTLLLNQLADPGEQETWGDEKCKEAYKVALELKAKLEARDEDCENESPQLQ